jgi:hypothetical protein
MPVALPLDIAAGGQAAVDGNITMDGQPTGRIERGGAPGSVTASAWRTGS